MCKTFKAKIIGSYTLIYDTPDNPRHETFNFTKNKIKFLSPDPKREYFVGIPLVHGFADGAEYSIDKVYDKNEMKRFLITINKQGKAFIEMNLWNSIKCHIIHKRTLYHKHKKWFWGLVVAAFLAALFKKGFDSLLENRSNNQKENPTNIDSTKK